MDTKKEKQRLKKVYVIIEMIEDMDRRIYTSRKTIEQYNHLLGSRLLRWKKNLEFQFIAKKRLENYYKNLMK